MIRGHTTDDNLHQEIKQRVRRSYKARPKEIFYIRQRRTRLQQHNVISRACALHNKIESKTEIGVIIDIFLSFVEGIQNSVSRNNGSLTIDVILALCFSGLKPYHAKWNLKDNHDIKILRLGPPSPLFINARNSILESASDKLKFQNLVALPIWVIKTSTWLVVSFDPDMNE